MIFSNKTTDAVATSGGTGFTTAGGTVLTSLGKVKGTEKERRSGYLSGKSKRLGVGKDKGHKVATTALSTNSTVSNEDDWETKMDELHTQAADDSFTAKTQFQDSKTGSTHTDREGLSDSKPSTNEDQNLDDDTAPSEEATPTTSPRTTGQVKRTQIELYSTEKHDTRVQTTAQDIMKRRGEMAVEAATSRDTPIQVEFKITKATKNFNLREALGKLLTVMIEVDKTVKIQDNEGKEQWNDSNELPIGEAMKRHFIIRQDSPPYEAPKITVYFTLKSTQTANDIKYHPHVITHLKQFNIFMRPDRYQTSKARSPGYFVGIAPRLVWKNTFIQELKDSVQLTTFDMTNSIIQDYYRDNNLSLDTDPEPPMPELHVHVATRKFGTVTAEVLTVTCADGDALYLKKLLSTMAEQGNIKRGQFVPTGLHLVAGPATVTHLLRNQNGYMDTITVIAVEGLKETVLETPLFQQMTRNIPAILSIERTSATIDKGKWFIVLKKSSADKFQHYLDTELRKMVRKSDLIDGYEYPVRAGAHKSANVVGSYAEILKRTVHSTNTHKPNQYNRPQQRPKKRFHVDLLHPTNISPSSSLTGASATWGNDSYAARLSANFHKTSHLPHSAFEGSAMYPKEMRHHPSKSCSSTEETMDVTNTAPTTTTISTQELEKKLTDSLDQKLEDALNKKLAEFKMDFTKEMETKMATISNTIEAQITDLIHDSLSKLTTTVQSTLQQQMDLFMATLTDRMGGEQAPTTIKRVNDQKGDQPQMKRRQQLNGEGPRQNATCIEQPNIAANAMQE